MLISYARNNGEFSKAQELINNARGSGSTFLSSRLADTLCDELANKEEYAFIRDCSEFRELVAQMSMV